MEGREGRGEEGYNSVGQEVTDCCAGWRVNTVILPQLFITVPSRDVITDVITIINMLIGPLICGRRRFNIFQ